MREKISRAQSSLRITNFQDCSSRSGVNAGKCLELLRALAICNFIKKLFAKCLIRLASL